MGSFKVTDEWLYQQMPKVDKALLEADMLELEDEDRVQHQFSRRFERKMNQLLKRERRASVRSGFRRFGKQIAMFFLVILLTSATVVMSVTGLREAFFQATETFFESFALVEFTNQNELEGFRVISPKYVPEGFNRTQNWKNKKKSITKYWNEAGNYFILQQYVIFVKENILDTDYDLKKKITINGEEAELFIKDNFYTSIVWYIGDIRYNILSDVLSEEEIAAIASSVVE